LTQRNRLYKVDREEIKQSKDELDLSKLQTIEVSLNEGFKKMKENNASPRLKVVRQL
jgi:hypothetical protein